MSRHRIRRLEDGRYVCSKRFCPFSHTDLSIAMKHINFRDVAVAPKQEPTTDARAA